MIAQIDSSLFPEEGISTAVKLLDMPLGQITVGTLGLLAGLAWSYYVYRLKRP